MINDTCFNGKIACHGMLRFISQTNPCIRKFLDLKRCNSLKSKHRSEVLFFQLFEQAFLRRAKARRARREALLSLTRISCRLRRQEIWVRGYLPLARAISLGKLQKTWAVICGNAICLIFSVFSADLDILFSSSFSHLVKFYIYAQDFHPGCLCNGKYPRINRMDLTYQKPNPRNPKASTVLSPFCIANTRLFSLFNCAVASSFPKYLWIITTSLVSDPSTT